VQQRVAQQEKARKARLAKSEAQLNEIRARIFSNSEKAVHAAQEHLTVLTPFESEIKKISQNIQVARSTMASFAADSFTKESTRTRNTSASVLIPTKSASSRHSTPWGAHSDPSKEQVLSYFA